MASFKGAHRALIYLAGRGKNTRKTNALDNIQHLIPMLANVGLAWLAGAAIGLERSFHGRPAGFRTHALVCMSSALLMVLMNYQEDWLGALAMESIRTDPARTAQGIMTGIGFPARASSSRKELTVRG